MTTYNARLIRTSRYCDQNSVTKCGEQYGLQVHWGKVHLVPVCTDQSVTNLDGVQIAPQESLVYLGATIHANGKFGCEVARKIGAATATFKTLELVWKHASISTNRKLRLFDSLIQSRLRYAVASAWLLKSDLRRMNGFQANCLRRILKVPPAFYSRVSNKSVLERSGLELFSASVRKLQLKLLGQVITNPCKSVLKQVAFHGSSLVAETSAYVKRIGRPRQNWTEQLIRLMKEAASTTEAWTRAVGSLNGWQEVSSRIIS